MTTLADPPTLLNWVEKVIIPIVTFVIGFLISHFTLNKKDRKDVEQKNYENSVALVGQHRVAYEAYAAALKTYDDAALASANDFFQIATTGETYFYVLGLMSSAILSDKVDPKLRDNVMLRKIQEATERTLPHHYEALKAIAQKFNFPYTGELRLADYEALYAAIGKYGAQLDWTNG